MIIDTTVVPDGTAYTLALLNTGEYIITDSDGNIQDLSGMNKDEAYAEYYKLVKRVQPEPSIASSVMLHLQRYGIDIPC